MHAEQSPRMNAKAAVTFSFNERAVRARAEKYTIAWICALYIELAAGRAMLDEIHDDPLPVQGSDINSYTLGRIGQHNVVMACLPMAQYGTNNAAHVISNLLRTFPSIRCGLMVGIGGGATSKADLRLGDIVVGTRVMQFDLGKMSGGEVQRTATARIVHPSLSTVVANLRAKHELQPSRVPLILREKMADYPHYNHPGLPDRLFQANYDHVSLAPNCDQCDQSKLVLRSKRASDAPVIHYGAIASGNQVMKDALSRDKVAKELEVFCFEMEAAGLMDAVPCLPIRGICDYSDSHKTKEWQRYASATAAACARELLEILPPSQGPVDPQGDTNVAASRLTVEKEMVKRTKSIMESLRFLRMGDRLTIIRPADEKTCQWFLNHPHYKAWLDPHQLEQHHGFLWIAGKPGAGKSTLMKFLFQETERALIHDQVVISFFFNARGSTLEKSAAGMFRSLLLQLYTVILQSKAFLPIDIIPSLQGDQGCPPLDVLETSLTDTVKKFQNRDLTFFLDALDECDEQQAVHMIDYFENLGKISIDNGVRLRICFSSRHYPYIEIGKRLRLNLEDQPGHARDLASYVQMRLHIGNYTLFEDIKAGILKKAAGVFWVALVVDILNTEARRGRPTLKQKLEELPSGLGELFKEILRRDEENMEDLYLCFIWLLFGATRLSPPEYYHALWAGLYIKGLVEAHVPRPSDDTIAKFVISSSKGLVEITKTKEPVVQFIHESVRDFLLKDNGLRELWPALGFEVESYGHETLKKCCEIYMAHPSILRSGRVYSFDRSQMFAQYPLLEYASLYIFWHADKAALVFPQSELLTRSDIRKCVYRCGQQRKHDGTEEPFIFYLAKLGLSNLVQAYISIHPGEDVIGEEFEHSPFLVALSRKHTGTASALLDLPSNTFDAIRDLTVGTKDLPIIWAAQRGATRIVKALLHKGVDVDALHPESFGSALSVAALGGHLATAKLLLRWGANVNGVAEDNFTPLEQASRRGHKTMIKFLLDNGAKIIDNTPLLFAIQGNHEAAAKILIQRAVQANNDFCGDEPLILASDRGLTRLVILLIREKANVNARDMSRCTPVMKASAHGHAIIMETLIEKGAEVDADNQDGRTALFIAIQNSQEAATRLLLDHGADVNFRDNDQSTPLIFACKFDDLDIIKLLIQRGGSVDAINSKGQTPLQIAILTHNPGAVDLLLSAGVDANQCDKDGIPALWLALKNDSWGVPLVLIRKGANPNTKDPDFECTPLLWSLRNGLVSVVKPLIESGAEIDIQDSQGCTPLVIASRQNLIDIVRLLLERGADLNISNENGTTALMEARTAGHQEIVSLLLRKEARGSRKRVRASTESQGTS